MKANIHPLDLVFRLAEDHGIVLLNGGGFEAPDWSVRVSFANLDDEVYDDIGGPCAPLRAATARPTRRRSPELKFARLIAALASKWGGRSCRGYSTPCDVTPRLPSS